MIITPNSSVMKSGVFLLPFFKKKSVQREDSGQKIKKLRIDIFHKN